ncbi:MAG: hypothetical protein O6940_01640 [Ignavibacteria bacterium]|nr:hypothetical protein [Ignavibacteria bacterium]
MDNNSLNITSFYGEVAGIYEKDGNHFILLHYNSGFIDIELKDVENIYLGDKIIVHSNLIIKNIITQWKENKQN